MQMHEHRDAPHKHEFSKTKIVTGSPVCHSVCMWVCCNFCSLENLQKYPIKYIHKVIFFPNCGYFLCYIYSTLGRIVKRPYLWNFPRPASSCVWCTTCYLNGIQRTIYQVAEYRSLSSLFHPMASSSVYCSGQKRKSSLTQLLPSSTTCNPSASSSSKPYYEGIPFSSCPLLKP